MRFKLKKVLYLHLKELWRHVPAVSLLGAHLAPEHARHVPQIADLVVNLFAVTGRRLLSARRRGRRLSRRVAAAGRSRICAVIRPENN